MNDNQESREVTQEIRVGIRKTEFDEMMTDFGKSRHSLRGNEELDVKEVTIDRDIVIIKADLSERNYQ